MEGPQRSPSPPHAESIDIDDELPDDFFDGSQDDPDDDGFGADDPRVAPLNGNTSSPANIGVLPSLNRGSTFAANGYLTFNQLRDRSDQIIAPIGKFMVDGRPDDDGDDDDDMDDSENTEDANPDRPRQNEDERTQARNTTFRYNARISNWRDACFEIASRSRRDNNISVDTLIQFIESIGSDMHRVSTAQDPEFNENAPVHNTDTPEPIVEDSDSHLRFSQPQIAGVTDSRILPHGIEDPSPLAVYEILRGYYPFVEETPSNPTDLTFRRKQEATYRSHGYFQMHPESIVVYEKNVGVRMGNKKDCFLCNWTCDYHKGIEKTHIATIHEMMWNDNKNKSPEALAFAMHFYYMKNIYHPRQTSPMLSAEACYTHIVGYHVLDPLLVHPQQIRDQQVMVQQSQASVFRDDGTIDDKKYAAYVRLNDQLIRLQKENPAKRAYYNTSAKAGQTEGALPTSLYPMITSDPIKADPVQGPRLYIS